MAFSRHPGPPPILCRNVERRRGIDVSTSFRMTRAPTCYRRRSPRPRSPFTPAAFPFRGCCTGAYSRPDVATTTSATTTDVRALRPGLSCSSKGRRPQPPSFSDAPPVVPCGTGDARRAALRPHEREVGVGSSGCPVCPTAIPRPARHLLSFDQLSPAKRRGVSDDRRARAPGPSEGRVTERVSSESCRSSGCVAL